jgi:hypothetical protein
MFILLFLFYCQELFQLINSERNSEAGGAIRKTHYRNPKTGEIEATENSAVGVCLQCAEDIMRRQLPK